MLRNLTAVAVFVLLSSCAAMQKEQVSTSTAGSDAVGQDESVAAKVDASAELSTSAAKLAESSTGESQRSEPIVYRGSDRQVRLPAVQEQVRFVGEDVSLNFEQAPLSEVMHAIMGDIL
jgi:general secretion pathway protein D